MIWLMEAKAVMVRTVPDHNGAEKNIEWKRLFNSKMVKNKDSYYEAKTHSQNRSMEYGLMGITRSRMMDS